MVVTRAFSRPTPEDTVSHRDTMLQDEYAATAYVSACNNLHQTRPESVCPKLEVRSAANIWCNANIHAPRRVTRLFSGMLSLGKLNPWDF